MGFSQTEANGFLVLLPLIFLIVLSPLLYERFFITHYDAYESDHRLLDSLNRQLQLAFIPKKEELQHENFLFNPNHISQDSMILLGIPSFLAQRIVNYRSKGGRFYETNDLANIYDFPDSLYRRLSAWVVLEESNKLVSGRSFTAVTAHESKGNGKAQVVLKQPKEVDVEAPVLVDINTADTLGLQKIFGIGPSFARRIVKYRELLGGYIDVQQLQEVYGLSDTLFQKIEAHITIADTVKVTTIPINLADFKALVAHPYISYEMTKAILSAKSQYGKFRKPEDLFKIEAADSAWVYKLAPYLSF